MKRTFVPVDWKDKKLDFGIFSDYFHCRGETLEPSYEDDIKANYDTLKLHVNDVKPILNMNSQTEYDLHTQVAARQGLYIGNRPLSYSAVQAWGAGAKDKTYLALYDEMKRKKKDKEILSSRDIDTDGNTYRMYNTVVTQIKLNYKFERSVLSDDVAHKQLEYVAAKARLEDFDIDYHSKNALLLGPDNFAPQQVIARGVLIVNKERAAVGKPPVPHEEEVFKKILDERGNQARAELICEYFDDEAKLNALQSAAEEYQNTTLANRSKAEQNTFRYDFNQRFRSVEARKRKADELSSEVETGDGESQGVGVGEEEPQVRQAKSKHRTTSTTTSSSSRPHRSVERPNTYKE